MGAEPWPERGDFTVATFMAKCGCWWEPRQPPLRSVPKPASFEVEVSCGGSCGRQLPSAHVKQRAVISNHPLLCFLRTPAPRKQVAKPTEGKTCVYSSDKQYWGGCYWQAKIEQVEGDFIDVSLVPSLSACNRAVDGSRPRLLVCSVQVSWAFLAEGLFCAC